MRYAFDHDYHIHSYLSSCSKDPEQTAERILAYAEENGHIYLDTVGAGLTTKYEPEEEPDTAHYDCGSTVRLGELFAEHIRPRG